MLLELINRPLTSVKKPELAAVCAVFDTADVNKEAISTNYPITEIDASFYKTEISQAMAIHGPHTVI